MLTRKRIQSLVRGLAAALLDGPWEREAMMSRTVITAILFAVVGCAPSAEEDAQVLDAQGSDAPSWLDGVREYVPPLQGQSMSLDGHFTYLWGPSDGSGPMISDAGTYEVSGDTVTNTVHYSSVPERVGVVFRWTPGGPSMVRVVDYH